MLKARPLLLLAAAMSVAASRAGAATQEAAVRSPVCRHGEISVERDPRGLLRLPANAIGPASDAALRRESRKLKPVVIAARLASVDPERGFAAKSECGARVWKRTVVVYITLTSLLPSSSLSERVDFVGRFSDGYQLWQVVH